MDKSKCDCCGKGADLYTVLCDTCAHEKFGALLATTEPQKILLAMWKEMEAYKPSWGATHDGSFGVIKKFFAKYGVKEYLDKNGLLPQKEENNGRT
jgi:hypothetical protein